MKSLNNRDLRTLLIAIEHLNSDFDPQTLRERALSAASKVIDADSVTFTGINYNGGLSGLAWDNSESISPEQVEIFGQYMHEHPLVTPYMIERRTETLQITDLMPAEEFEWTGIYNEFYRQMNVRNQLVSPLPISQDLFVSCSANTSRQHFSERTRLMSMLLAPHLINAIRNAFAYERVNSALETKDCGIIAISSSGKPLFISEFADQLLEKYFAGEKREPSSLPEILDNWLNRTNANDLAISVQPLKIENEKGKLIVRFMDNNKTGEKTLLLEEKGFADPKAFEQLSITQREAEILFWITQGKSDKAIAILCGISPRTVQKHVENICIKLGVESRTAAMSKALEILS